MLCMASNVLAEARTSQKLKLNPTEKNCTSRRLNGGRSNINKYIQIYHLLPANVLHFCLHIDWNPYSTFNIHTVRGCDTEAVFQEGSTRIMVPHTYDTHSAGVIGWISDSYCSIKPLCSGMGEVVPARTSPTLLPPSPRTVLSYIII